MICPICGGDIFTDHACFGCHITYSEMIDTIRHDSLRKLMEKKNLDKNDEQALKRELENSSFLVPAVFEDSELNVMTASDSQNRNYILLFTDREEYDKNNMDINPITNPFNEILDLLDDRFEGFVINICSEEFDLNREFLNRHFLGEQDGFI